jgi:hypothetical protein
VLILDDFRRARAPAVDEVIETLIDGELHLVVSGRFPWFADTDIDKVYAAFGNVSYDVTQARLMMPSLYPSSPAKRPRRADDRFAQRVASRRGSRLIRHF